jgi:hypothetical protein
MPRRPDSKPISVQLTPRQHEVLTRAARRKLSPRRPQTPVPQWKRKLNHHRHIH